jgi:catechol 2,3-dioxygenase-like lactoylglutathione lyase family enzyme
MIDHISVGVTDLDRSAKFYETTLAALGLTRLVARPRTIGFGKAYPEFWINLREGMPHVAAESGVHICLRAKTTAEVDAFTPRRCPPAVRPTARQASVRMTACATTRPSSPIPMATGSRR